MYSLCQVKIVGRILNMPSKKFTLYVTLQFSEIVNAYFKAVLIILQLFSTFMRSKSETGFFFVLNSSNLGWLQQLFLQYIIFICRYLYSCNRICQRDLKHGRIQLLHETHTTFIVFLSINQTILDLKYSLKKFKGKFKFK